MEIWLIDNTSSIEESVCCSSQLPRPCRDYQENDGWDSLWLSRYNWCCLSKRCVGTQCWAKTLELTIVPRSQRGCLSPSAQVPEAKLDTYILQEICTARSCLHTVHTYCYTLTFSSHQHNDVMCFYQLTFLQVPVCIILL